MLRVELSVADSGKGMSADVVGRVDLQRDQRPDVAEVDRFAVGREDLGVAEGLVERKG